MPTPEDQARKNFDQLLTKADWAVRNQSNGNILAHRRVVIRNFTLKPGHGFADDLFHLDGRAARVPAAKEEGGLRSPGLRFSRTNSKKQDSTLGVLLSSVT